MNELMQLLADGYEVSFFHQQIENEPRTLVVRLSAGVVQGLPNVTVEQHFPNYQSGSIVPALNQMRGRIGTPG